MTELNENQRAILDGMSKAVCDTMTTKWPFAVALGQVGVRTHVIDIQVVAKQVFPNIELTQEDISLLKVAACNSPVVQEQVQSWLGNAKLNYRWVLSCDEPNHHAEIYATYYLTPIAERGVLPGAVRRRNSLYVKLLQEQGVIEGILQSIVGNEPRQYIACVETNLEARLLADAVTKLGVNADTSLIATDPKFKHTVFVATPQTLRTESSLLLGKPVTLLLNPAHYWGVGMLAYLNNLCGISA